MHWDHALPLIFKSHKKPQVRNAETILGCSSTSAPTHDHFDSHCSHYSSPFFAYMYATRGGLRFSSSRTKSTQAKIMVSAVIARSVGRSEIASRYYREVNFWSAERGPPSLRFPPLITQHYAGAHSLLFLKSDAPAAVKTQMASGSSNGAAQNLSLCSTPLLPLRIGLESP